MTIKSQPQHTQCCGFFLHKAPEKVLQNALRCDIMIVEGEYEV